MIDRELVEPKREYLGWIFLALLFSLILASTFSQGAASDPSSIRLSEAESTLQSAVAEYGSNDKSTTSFVDRSLDELQQSVASSRLSDPVSAEIYAASLTLRGKTLTAKDLSPMVKSKNVLDRNAAVIYGSKTLKKDDAERLSTGLAKRGFLGKLMGAQALAKAGDPTAIKKLTQNSSTSTGVAGVFIMVIGAASFAAWAVVIAEKRAGRLVPLGMPIAVPTLYDADRLALRAASLTGLYLVLSSVPELINLGLHAKVSSGVMTLVSGVAMLVAMPIVFRKPVLDQVVSPTDIGGVRRDFLRLAGIGLLGFLLEMPLTYLLGSIGQLLLSGVHHASHPATVELSNQHDALTVISIFFLASIVAPIWEEVMFRGLLFPAVGRVTGSVIGSAVLTSFLFGALHPQGLPLWFALMAVGGMSCALSYHTKSLVPSVVMHMAHNTALLALTILYT